MPDDQRPPKDYFEHMKSAHGMSDELAGWIFHNKMGGDRSKASASVSDKEANLNGTCHSQADEWKEEFRNLNSGGGNKETLQKSVLKNRKLVDTKNLQEAIRVLDARNIHADSAVRKLVGLAWQMTEDDDKKATLEQAEDSANHEMEDPAAMGKEKGVAEQGGQKNAAEQKQNSEARENSGEESKLHGNPAGSPGSDVPPVKAPEGKGDQKNADEQKGGDQLGGGNKENQPYQQMMPQQPSPDLLNAKMIDLMDPAGAGMSKIAAENAAAVQGRDQMGFMQEALNPALTKIWNDMQATRKELTANREAIEFLSTQKDASKISMKGPVGPGGNKNQEALIPGLDPTQNGTSKLQEISDDPVAKEEFKRDIEQIYL